MSRRQTIDDLAQRIANGDQIDTRQIIENGDNTALTEALSRINRLSRSFSQPLDSEPEDDIEPGEQWGHLRIDSLIGEGGMGRVYRAHDETLDSHVAIKFLSYSARQYINSELFIAEARRMARVRHPNVLAVFGAATHDARTGFWCEYLRGQTLHEYLASHRPAHDEVLSIAADLASAVKAVHGAGLIHADIKTLNVMIEPVRGAVLMDFGAGIDLEHDTHQPFSQQATPAIMAPEQFDGHDVDTPCDIFALGILMFTLSSGMAPFTGPTISELSDQVCHPERVDYSKLSGNRRWQRLLASMLATDPSARPDIDAVQAEITRLRQAPLKRARKVALASVTGLIAAIAITTSYAWITTRIEQQKTQAALQESLEYNGLLNEILTSASPVSRGKDTLMLDVIETAEQRLMDQTAVRSELHLQALHNIAWTYKILDDPVRSLTTAEHILSLDPDPQTRFDVHLMMALQTLSQSDRESTEAHLNELASLYGQFELSPMVEREYWVTLSDYQRSFGDIASAEDAMSRARSVIDDNDLSRSVHMMMSESHLLTRASRFSEALALLQDALSAMRSECSCDMNINILALRSEIAINRLNLGDAATGQQELEVLHRDAAAFLGESHYLTEDLFNNYLTTLNQTGDYSKLVELMTPRLSEMEHRYGSGSDRFQNAQNNLANAHLYLAEYDRAEQLYRNVIEQMTELNGEAHFNVLLAKYNLSELLYKSGNPAAARDLATDTLLLAGKTLGEGHLVTLELRDAAGWSLSLMGKHQQAINELEVLHADKQVILGEEHPYTLSTLAHLERARQQLTY